MGTPFSSLIVPEAIAPSAVPRSIGVMILAIENTRLQRRCTLSCCTSYVRKVKAVPRSTMPINSNVIGMCSAVAIAANAGGKAVNRTTTISINQT